MEYDHSLTLLEALTKARALDARPLPENRREQPFRVALLCGFEPLHLTTFLKAHLSERLVDRRVEVTTVTYGDLSGNLERALQSAEGSLAIFLEWTDLDARLGHRALGGWRAEDFDDALIQSKAALQHILDLVGLSQARPEIVLSLPSLPLPAAFEPFGAEFTERSAEIRLLLSKFTQDMAAEKAITVLNSPTGEGIHDLKSEIVTGFPYSLPFADRLSQAVARALCPPPRKKGLITDLDDTLWKGIVGDDGPEAVQWNLESGSVIHGLYQQALSALSASGILVAIASKNTEAVAMQALHRGDMIFQESNAFPIEIHWEPKSISVERILKAWNIAADDVVFIDDSEAELAEVKDAFPQITGLQFPTNDIDAAGRLLKKLGQLFGHREATAEDRIRADSLRRASEFEEASRAADHTENFLRGLDQVLAIDFADTTSDERAFELVNKTNQFNLNGRRYTHQDWQAHATMADGFSMVATYTDKFGSLGKIAALGGRRVGNLLYVDYWAMSCRAFGRRVEHACLRALFEQFKVDSIVVDFEKTDRNGPFVGFAEGIFDEVDRKQYKVESDAFLRQCPTLYHCVTIGSQEEVHTRNAR